jgi:predicted CXXCH cytochrome family protein
MSITSRQPGARGPAAKLLELAVVAATILGGPAGCIGPEGKDGGEGTIGATGTTGASGPAGATGVPGAPGQAGEPGPRGPQGAAGTPGNAGAQGPQGESGAKGEPGEVGPAGPQGERGEPGIPGPGYLELDADGLVGVVQDTADEPVAGARVFLIPNDAIVATPVALADFGADALDDEPIEDLVRADLMNPTLPRVETDSQGRYHFDTLPDTPFFVVVWPAEGDTEHLPGGKGCRTPVAAAEAIGTQRDIEISTAPPEGAYYVGSQACSTCHGRVRQAGTMMANGLRLLHGNTGRQKLHEASFPGIPALRGKFAAGQSVYFGAPVGGLYPATEADPGAGARLRLDLRSDANGDFVQFNNLENPADPNDGREYAVEFTYGGGLTAANLIVKIGNSRQILPLKFNIHGDDARPEAEAHVWTDAGLALWFDDAAGTLREPGGNESFDLQCAGCHFTGFTLSGDAATGYRAHGTDTDDGLFDYDGNGFNDEMNIGCESCHGPGSAHWDNAGQGKFIVSPGLLTPERENLLCGRCHSRPEGAHGAESPMDANGNFPPAGIDRPTFFALYTQVADAVPGQDTWTDAREHSKGNHQQATDFQRSLHARNQRHLMTCSDCHDVHGTNDTTPYLLVASADDDSICNRCHELEGPNKIAHITQTTTFDHAAITPRCIDCHMPMTARNGAGGRAVVAGADRYRQGDVASHQFVVPRKSELVGVPAADAMPVPYTNGCGVCHAAFAPAAP